MVSETYLSFTLMYALFCYYAKREPPRMFSASLFGYDSMLFVYALMIFNMLISQLAFVIFPHGTMDYFLGVIAAHDEHIERQKSA